LSGHFEAMERNGKREEKREGGKERQERDGRRTPPCTPRNKFLVTSSDIMNERE